MTEWGRRAMKLLRHRERWALDKIDLCISQTEPGNATKRKKERTTLEQSSQQQEKQISFSGCCWETAPKAPHTIKQHSQCCSYLHYLPVSSMNAAEMTGVQRSDLITRSGGGLKLLYHISILTPQTSSGRTLWDKTGDKTRPVRPRIHNLSLIDS